MYKLNNLIPVLLSKGALINEVSSFGSTALHLACSVGNVEAAHILIANGADCCVLDSTGMTSAAVAQAAGFESLAELITSGASHSPALKQDLESSFTSEVSLHDLAPEINSSRFLQEAFESLSLVDKCALSISFGHSQRYLHKKSLGEAGDDSGMDWEGTKALSADDLRSTSDTANLSEDFELQSVLSDLSDGDRESMNAYISLMGPEERASLEGEVKLIQNNVRCWLLRKNYINLREATKTVQL